MCVELARHGAYEGGRLLSMIVSQLLVVLFSTDFQAFGPTF